MDPLSLTLLILPGMVGGLIRGLVGVGKNVWKDKKEFSIFKILYTLIIAAIVGGVASALVDGDWRVALLAGFAGSDLIESLYKSKLFGFLK